MVLYSFDTSFKAGNEDFTTMTAEVMSCMEMSFKGQVLFCCFNFLHLFATKLETFS